MKKVFNLSLDLVLCCIMFVLLHIININVFNVSYLICVLLWFITISINGKLETFLDLQTNKHKSGKLKEITNNLKMYTSTVLLKLFMSWLIIVFVYPIIIVNIFDIIWISHLHLFSNSLINSIIFIVIRKIILYPFIDNMMTDMMNNIDKYKKEGTVNG